MIERPRGWRDVIFTIRSQEFIDQVPLNGLLAGGTRGKEGTHACYYAAAYSQKNKAGPDLKSSQPHAHHKWHTDQVCKTDQVKAQEMGPNFFQTFSCAAVHCGDIPEKCIARVVVHGQTIFYERQLEVAPHAPAVQADVRASGERLLDRDQPQKAARSLFYKLFREKNLKKSISVSKKRYGGGRTHSGVVTVNKQHSPHGVDVIDENIRNLDKFTDLEWIINRWSG